MKLLLYIPAAFIAACWNGFVLSVLWGWFIVPVFQAPTLRIPYAIGLAIVVSMLTHQIDWKRAAEDDYPEVVKLLGGSLVALFALGYGWIVRLFV